jgi:hypothetical protein
MTLSGLIRAAYRSRLKQVLAAAEKGDPKDEIWEG